VVEKTKHHILDTFAAMISGAELAPGRVGILFARAHSGEKIATVAGTDVVCGPIEAAVANGMTAPVALTMFERAGASTGGSADLTMAKAVRAAPGLDPHRLAAAWNLTADHADRLLSGADAGPLPPAPAPMPPPSAASPEGDLQAARQRLLGTQPQPDPRGATP